MKLDIFLALALRGVFQFTKKIDFEAGYYGVKDSVNNEVNNDD